MKNRRGQVVVGVIALLLVLMIIVPAMVSWVQNEAKWSVKEGRSTNAFQIAEGAVDRGYQMVTQSTGTWTTIQAGGAAAQISGFHFDQTYSDLSGGTYAISVTSGPGLQTVTIMGVGRDLYQKDVRTLNVQFTNAALRGVSILGVSGVSMTGNNVQVEWGSVVSPQAITIGAKIHPAYYSAGSIDLDANGATPPNCDAPNCWWWHSYYTQLPPTPAIDFGSYKSSAIASGLSAACGFNYYIPASSTPFSTQCPAADTTGKTFYIEGDWNSFKSAIVGNVIVLGNMSFQNGKAMMLGSYNATIPATAWKNYCNDWATYQAYDPGAVGQPACFGSLTNTYVATGVTSPINPEIHGFLYVGGNLTIPMGGGGSDLLHGIIMVQGNASISTSSPAHIYYDDSVSANLLTTKIVLVRSSWKETPTKWLGP